MRRPRLIFSMMLLSGLAAGCRCPLTNAYANLIDDINDTHIYFDRWYCPRLDVSRAGKPDWCGPINSSLYPGICYLGSWDRYDDDNLYPPSNPYSLPSNIMPPPKVWQAPQSDNAPVQSLTPVPPEPGPGGIEPSPAKVD